MRLALVTDVHFGPQAYFEGKLRKLTARAPEFLGEFVTAMNTEVRPDRVVQLGDAIEDAELAADKRTYREFLGVLSRLDAELLHVAGNHDLKNLTTKDLAELWQRPEPLFYSHVVVDKTGFTVQLVVLCTEERTDIDVRIAAQQVAWFEQTLAQAVHPVVVLVHHPLCDMDLAGNRWFERAPHLCRVVERRRVREVIEHSGKVRAVFQGHAHWNHLSVIKGIPYITLQSLIENVDDDAPGRAARAHAVVDIGPHRLRVRVGGEERCRYQFDYPAGT